ncbi:hypothetical protein DFJ73DRAFT_841919 [Zopfochytrium polystomum]|nr:hypothetical protein DFJ73DRAFT_841919 [Zopfochytrium polystomum]
MLGFAETARFQWFLRRYPTIGVAMSLAISVPLAIFKYNIAKENERRISEESFNSAANLVFLSLDKQWQFASVAPSLLADFSITAPGPLSNTQYSSFTDVTGYFAAVNSGFDVGMYQHATNATVEYWGQYMFDNHGGNLGSNTSFNFFTRNGSSAIINTTARDFYFLFHVQNENDDAAKTSLGYIADSDPVTRLPMIQRLQQTGLPTVSGRLTLVKSNSPLGVIIAAPIFKNSTLGATTKFTNKRTDEMDAFAIVAADLANIVKSTLSPIMLDSSIHVFVFDNDAKPSQSLLGHFCSGQYPPIDNLVSSLNMTVDIATSFASDFIMTKELALFNRKWIIVVMALQGYVASSQTSFPMRLLFIALIEPAISIVFHLSIFAVHRLWIPGRSNQKL